MRLLGTELSAVSESHLAGLIDNGVGESKHLEYKKELNLGSDREKKEFLADISALANSAGGVILFGMDTKRDSQGHDTGIPVQALGIDPGNRDSLLLRITAILRDSLEPSLTLGLSTAFIPLSIPDRWVFALGVERSLVGPHMVVFQKVNDFWCRSEAGKYPPDTVELRRMFMEAVTWAEEADSYHQKRLAELLRFGYSSHFVLVHALPLGRLKVFLDPRALGEAVIGRPMPLFGLGANFRHNAAGFKVFNQPRKPGPEHYVQWLRFGGVEGAAGGFVGEDENSGRRVNLEALRSGIDVFLSKAVGTLDSILGVAPPYHLSLSLAGIGNLHPWLGGIGSSWGAEAFDADPISLPPIILDSPSLSAKQLQPWWDTLWQSVGISNAPPPHAS